MKSLFTQKGLAVVAFLCVLVIFLINSNYVCPDDSEPTKLNIKEDGSVVRDINEVKNETWLEKVCNVKKSMVTNLLVIFLVITVVR